MTVEADLYSVLASLSAGRVFPDVGPAAAALPYLTYQQVGGEAVLFLAGLPSKKNGRFQINAWAATRSEAAALIRLVEDTVRSSGTLIYGTPFGASVAVYDEETHYFGARQDFSIWYGV